MSFYNKEIDRKKKMQPKLISLVNTATESHINCLKQSIQDVSFMNQKNLKELDGLDKQAKKLEDEVNMYEKWWGVRAERSAQNTVRICFDGLIDDKKMFNNNKIAGKVDLVFSDDLLLVTFTDPVIKNVIEIQNELNLHRRMDLFVLRIRNEFLTFLS